MILQELCKLYDRLETDPDYRIPRSGFSLQKISFSIVLNSDGTLFKIEDERVERGTKGQKNKVLEVPGEEKPSGSGINPCILWDNPAYLLGYAGERKKDEKDGDYAKRVARAKESFEKSKELHLSLREKIAVPQFQAVCNFLKNWDPEALTENQKEILKNNGFGVFRSVGENRYIHEIPEVESAVLTHLSGTAVQAENDDCSSLSLESESAETSEKTKKKKAEKKKDTPIFCLVSGKQGKLARTHNPKIKGVAGAQSSGALLVSFNESAFESYKKEQGENAPVSEESAQKYCKALNALLSSDKHRLRLGGTTVVFWTEQKTQTEDLLAAFFDPPKRDEENQNSQDAVTLQKIKNFWETLREAGTPQCAFEKLQWTDSSVTPFFMLGLSPSAARLSVRFWHAGTLGGFLEKLKAHHAAMCIQKSFPNDPDFIPIWQVLARTARDADGVSPVLGGELMRSILEGTKYPATLLPSVLRRISVSSGSEKYKCGSKVSYQQASIVKAVLVKNFKIIESKKMETLDTQNENTAYRLGRLFAVIEKVQSDASGGVNAGVGDKYFSTASCTPSVVFPTLIDLHRKHLSKLRKDKPGLAVDRDKLVQGILSTIKEFPKTLSIEERGLFVLGYYHQMRALFAKKADDGDGSTSATNENE